MATRVRTACCVLAVVRKLQEFESPYISLKAANEQGTHRIVLRKRYRSHPSGTHTPFCPQIEY